MYDLPIGERGWVQSYDVSRLYDDTRDVELKDFTLVEGVLTGRESPMTRLVDRIHQT